LREPRGAYITYAGRETFEQFMHAVLTIHANENYATIHYVTHDMLGPDDVDFADVDMTKIVVHELGARYTNTTVRPAVASTNPTMGEMVKVFKAMTPLDVGFCPSVKQARQWCAS
jgi:hypothetical protein